jgi:hypothetical protein
MDLENLPPQIQFAFISMLKSAIDFKESGKKEKDFLQFAKGIWETMEMSDLKDLKEIIIGKMRKDLEPAMKSYMEKQRGK